MDDSLGIYIHVPFCKNKCSYCNFYSLCKYSARDLENYTQSVCSKISQWGKTLKKTVNTIYFGGGTPSLMGSENISKILNQIESNFEVSSAEITIEVNPGDYDILNFKKLKACGVNRVSVGVQSSKESELKILGRRHGIREIICTLDALKEAGINNFSVDFIIGTPTQTTESLDDFVKLCTYNHIPHVSAYLLSLEKNTPLCKQNKYKFLSDDELGELYEYFSERMRLNGYLHYEISNFSLPGFESKHNLRYWNLSDYLGLGPSAHSMINKKRFYYPSSVEKFISDTNYIPDGSGGSEEEYIMLQLRLRDGLRNEEYKSMFGKDIPKKYFEKAKAFENLGLIKTEKDCIALTTKGFLVSNQIICEFLY